MTSPLEQAIDSLSDPTVGLADALRRLLVVSRRIGSGDLTDFLRAELDGHENADSVPPNRKVHGLAVTVVFDGYGGRSDRLHVTETELPSELKPTLQGIGFAEPAAELEALATAEGKSDPRLELPLAWVLRYRTHIETNSVPNLMMMNANQAFISLPRTHLRGMLDRIRTAALDLALNLEAVSPAAGSPAGPTVQTEPKLAAAVNQYISVNAAVGSTVAIGDNATIASGTGATAIQLTAGDITGLLEASGQFITAEGVTALREALEEDGNQPGDRTKSLLERVRSGAYTLAGGVAGSGAYDGLVQLLTLVFPGS